MCFSFDEFPRPAAFSQEILQERNCCGELRSGLRYVLSNKRRCVEFDGAAPVHTGNATISRHEAKPERRG